jgi:hypothetical protein
VITGEMAIIAFYIKIISEKDPRIINELNNYTLI